MSEAVVSETEYAGRTPRSSRIASSLPSTKSTAFVLFASVGYALLRLWLFPDRLRDMSGLNVTISSLLVLAVVQLRARPEFSPFFAVALLAIFASLVHPTALISLLFIASVIPLSLTRSRDLPRSSPRALLLVLKACFVGPSSLLTDLTAIARRASPRRILTALPVRVLRSWILPVVLLLPFMLLFSAANPVFEGLLDRSWTTVISSFSDLLSMDAVRSALRVIVWTCLMLALLRLRATLPSPSIACEARAERDGRYQFTIRFLILANALFALQNFFDATFLLGGSTLPQGMTYAEYAHRGAYPLLVTAILAGLFVLALFRPGGLAERSRLSRALVIGWLIQNGILLMSSAYRLSVYVEQYQLTRLRLAAFLWMGMIGFGLLCTAVRIARRKSGEWLIRQNLAAVVAVFLFTAIVNLDRRIAWYNVLHCSEISGKGAALHFDYLASLGAGSVPALTYYTRRTGGKSVVQALSVKRLQDTLKDSLADFRSWNITNLLLHRETVRVSEETAPGEGGGEVTALESRITA